MKRFGFIHVPKCAGRSIRKAVKPLYTEEETYGDNGRPKPDTWVGVNCILEHLQYRCMMDIPGMVFATILRHPVAIEQSWINFVLRRSKDKQLESRFRYYLAAAEANLDDYIERYITDGKMIDYFFIDPGDPEASAIRTIEHLDLVGFQDDFPDFVANLSKLLEAEVPVLHENISPVEIVFTAKQRAYVAWKTRKDCAFYRYARAIWHNVDDAYDI